MMRSRRYRCGLWLHALVWICVVAVVPGAVLGKVTATTAGARTLVQDGEVGVWVPLPSMKKLLADAKQVKSLSSVVDLQDERIKLLRGLLSDYRAEVADADRAAMAWRKAAEAQSKALKSAGAWYRSPIFWFAVGAASMAVVSIGLAATYANVSFR